MTFTDKPNQLQQTLSEEGLLYQMTKQIRRSLELQEILTSTVAEVRRFLATDRVKVYQFDADGSGEVIAESIHEQRLPSLLGLHFPTHDIPQEARELFVSVGQRSIIDVPSGKIGLSPIKSKETGKHLQTEDIYYRQVDPCHIQYLQAMGVESSLVVPILHYEPKGKSVKPQLWGLLVSHNTHPRTILKRELKVVQQVADQVAIAIAQSNLLTQALAQQKRESIINQVTTLLHQLPTIQFQAALEATIAAFGGVGGRLYIQQSGELYTWGDQPRLFYDQKNDAIEQHPVWQNWIAQSKQGKIWAIADLYKEAHLRVLALAFQPTPIRGLMVIPLYCRENFIGTLSIFRAEFDTEILWAGRCDQNQRQQMPRLSFDLWREEKKGQAPEWKLEDISLAQALYYHFSIAIEQQQMYKQVQALNLNLENRVKEQTAELEKSLLLTKVLKQVTDQIRSTLDLNKTLQTIVREVRTLLNSDRVLIYRIQDEYNGEVIVEEISGNWPSVLGINTPIGCFPEEYAHLYLRGRVRSINNVSTASLSACHQESLQNLQVQANLIVPINIGMQLWGLLIAHQCDAPRIWQDVEIDFLQQLGVQAAIAIQQAQLYEQTCAAETEAKTQATHLEHTLHELQETQTKLIHTEKMSSLGQLVAGVAHEINNPVNFIYANLSHASDYANQLLELLNLYQSRYPNADNDICTVTEAIDFDFLAQDLPKIMTSMQVGAERIRSIVLSLRNFSRLDEVGIKPADLHEGIDNTLLILQHRLKSNPESSGIEVIRDYGDLPRVECDAGQINQVFMNILNNAIDALLTGTMNNENNPYPILRHTSTLLYETLREQQAQGIAALSTRRSVQVPTIRISTKVSSDNSYALIRISDNGTGMTEDVKKRIFDPFFTTKQVGKGTGLGLTISYQIIVERHSGTMECISEPGKGTEFWIEIPLKALGKAYH